MVLPGRLRLGVASAESCRRLAAVYRRAMGMGGRCRLDVGFVRAVGLGDLSLWKMVFRSDLRLDLGAGTHMGAGVGRLAHREWIRRMGTTLAGLFRYLSRVPVGSLGIR